MRAWALLVVSSDAQAETVAHQRAWATQTATEKGWKIDREFSGVSSGKDGPRRLLRDLIGALRELPAPERPAWLLMIRADRVGRGRLVESQVALHELIDLGVRIWTRDAGELKLDSATDQIIAAVKAGLATLENEVRRDKMLSVYKRKRAAGLPVANRRPYGLMLGPDKNDRAVPELADAVRLAFTMRIEGATFYQISKKMGEVAPPVQFKHHTAPLQWGTVQVKRMLANRAYIGPVVDEVTFARAQRKMGVERRPRKFVWELGCAPLFCYCGRAMAGNIAHKKDRPESGHRYYRCFGKAHPSGWGRLVRADLLERAFADALAAMAADSDLIARYREPAPIANKLLGKALPAARRELDELDRQRTRIFDLNASGKLRDDDLQGRLDELAPKREELLARIADLSTQQTLAASRDRIAQDAEAAIREAAAVYAQATPTERNDLVRNVTAHLGGGLCVEADDSLAFRIPARGALRKRFG